MSGVLVESGMCEGDIVTSPLVWCVHGEGRVCMWRVKVCVNWMCDVGMCRRIIGGRKRWRVCWWRGYLEVKVYGCRHMYILVPKIVQ